MLPNVAWVKYHHQTLWCETQGSTFSCFWCIFIHWITTCLYSVCFSLYFILVFWSICLRLNYLPWKLKLSIPHITHRQFLKLFTTAKSNNIGRHLCMCEITTKPNLIANLLYQGDLIKTDRPSALSETTIHKLSFINSNFREY